uniref:protein Shroom3 n=1 Tax=Centroberyx gerrardi TaxID=166262 RepID=UPI003AAECD5B
ASTTDLSAGFDSGGGGYLRKSPDQYSSRGSMESLDPPQSSQQHPGVLHHPHHPLSHHSHTGPHPAYSSCHQLSSARSSNSIDHLHSKRDSAYSSFSTSSSIPEYLASAPSFSPERSYSLENVPQRGGGSGEMQQADIRYVRTVYDAQQGLSQEQELSSASAALLRNSDSRGGGGLRAGLGRELQGSPGGVCYRGNSSSSSSSSGSSSGGIPASNRHSVGPIWGQAAGRSSYESLKGAPAPPQRSDSYAAIRNHDRHERPNSWSSLEHARSLRSLHKGSWHHSSGSVASGKGSYGAEGQLHTVMEKSPESSPTTKPRQGGGFPQPAPSPGPSSGSPGGAAQSGRLMLPTGVYPVPQPEPHFAQMPSSGPGPSSTGVYPALAKESGRQQHQGLPGIGARDGGGMEGWRDGGMSAVENGYQDNPSSSSYSHSSSSSISPASTPLRTQAQEPDRPQQEEADSSLYRSHVRAAGGAAEGQAGPHRPQNHQGPHAQSFQAPHTHTNQGHNQMFQGHSQDFQGPQSTHGFRPPSSQSGGQERRDPFTPVQSRGDRSRTSEQPSVHPEPAVLPRVAQGQVATAPPAQLNPHPSPRHHSDSAALHHQHWERERDREHPLTRLEIALAEVQRCSSPDSVVTTGSSQGNSSYGDSSQVSDGKQGATRSLSVLEKVSRFERRERGGKQRSHSTGHAQNKANQHKNQPNEKGRSAPCGAEDLRNMLERSTSGTKAHRTMSYRGGSSDQTQHRNAADPSSALQRSRSTFQLGESEPGGGRDFPWRQDLQELLGPIQDASFNRSYRDSLKDAQSKVLRSTSFRRRDLTSPPPPAAPPVSSSNNHQPPPVSTKHHSLEKKGPKTMPKPLGGLVPVPPPLSSPPPVTSPHAPKERHMISPEMRGPSPPALPSVPPVGPPPSRICGRKRLTAEQKKRSYSEPENMHEVGVSDAETAALFRRGGETSVADRRRMFELAASRSVGGGASQSGVSRPELRQLQQDALAEYIERKRGRRREEGGQGRALRPRSAYLHPEHNNHTASSSSHLDTLSLSSTSSLLSLQDSGPDRSFSSGERRLCSTLPPGADLWSLFYPGRVTAPRPPPAALQPTSAPPDQQQDGAGPGAGPGRGSGRSASAEDLLERSEERQTAPQHLRSRSSPTTERLNQDVPAGNLRLFGVFSSEAGRCSVAEDRPAGRPVSPQLYQINLNPVQTAPDQGPGSSHPPVTRRERPKTGERQRAVSASTLAASVGLPCPFSPPGAPGGGGEWRASERLSLANLDAIAFPCVLQTAVGDGDDSSTGAATCDVESGSRAASSGAENPEEDRGLDLHVRHSLSDTYASGDTAKDFCRERAFSLDTGEGDCGENTGPASPKTPSPQPLVPPNRQEDGDEPLTPPPSVRQHLPSLRISESGLSDPVGQSHTPESSVGLSQEDFDEVFLQHPAPPSAPPPIRETDITEDFPPPPSSPPPAPQSAGSSENLDSPAVSDRRPSLHSPPSLPSSSFFPSPPPSLPLEPQPLPVSSSSSSPCGPDTQEAEDSLGLEYQPLPRRERSSEELRVEALSRQLVLRDRSLAPLLDTWGGKTTVELMEEIFPSIGLAGKSPWQRRGSSHLDD